MPIVKIHKDILVIKRIHNMSKIGMINVIVLLGWTLVRFVRLFRMYFLGLCRVCFKLCCLICMRKSNLNLMLLRLLRPSSGSRRKTLKHLPSRIRTSNRNYNSQTQKSVTCKNNWTWKPKDTMKAQPRNQ